MTNNIPKLIQMVDIAYFMLPSDVRQWKFYPIEIPIDVDNMGPVTIPEAQEVKYEVWDSICTTHASFDSLANAINHAMKLCHAFPNHKPNGTVCKL